MFKKGMPKGPQRSMPVITSTGDIVIEDGSEVTVEENENWDSEMTTVEEVTESQVIEEKNDIEISADQTMEEECVEFTEREEDNDFGEETEENIIFNDDENIVDDNTGFPDNLNFFDESDDSEDEIEGTYRKDMNVLVNLAGKKMSEEDAKYAAEMKTKMKEFFKKCSPDLTFTSLLHLFVQRIPQPKPIYVLSHDQKPKDPIPLHKYAILCSAQDCQNAYFREGADWESIEQKKNFFGFPPDTEKCKEWIESLGRLKYLNKTINEMQMYRVCEDHFKEDDFTNEYREELCETAVPSLLLGGNEEVISFEFE